MPTASTIVSNTTQMAAGNSRPNSEMPSLRRRKTNSVCVELFSGISSTTPHGRQLLNRRGGMEAQPHGHRLLGNQHNQENQVHPGRFGKIALLELQQVLVGAVAGLVQLHIGAGHSGKIV